MSNDLTTNLDATLDQEDLVADVTHDGALGEEASSAATSVGVSNAESWASLDSAVASSDDDVAGAVSVGGASADSDLGLDGAFSTAGERPSVDVVLTLDDETIEFHSDDIGADELDIAGDELDLDLLDIGC